MLFQQLRVSIKDQAFKEELPLLSWGLWTGLVWTLALLPAPPDGGRRTPAWEPCSFQTRDIQKMKADNLHRKPLTSRPLHLRHRGFGLRAHLRSSADPERFASWQNVAVCCIHLISSCENLSTFAHFSMVGCSIFRYVQLPWQTLGRPSFCWWSTLEFEHHISIWRHPRWFVCILKFQFSEVRNWLGFHQPAFFPNSQSQVLEVAAPELLEVMGSMGFTSDVFCSL